MGSEKSVFLGALFGVLFLFSASLCSAQDYRGTEFTLAYPKIPPTTMSVDIGQNQQTVTIYGMQEGEELSGHTPWSGAHGIATGDINGDGFEDLVLGAPYAYKTKCHEGAVYVLFGPLPAAPGSVRDLAVDTPDVIMRGRGGVGA